MSSGRVQKKSRIEIPLPSKPRPYRPGDGPALTPITLALKNDSDAFIIDKQVLLSQNARGEHRKEMWYVVGWPDLPAGRVAINARRIYDYVSPRTLEDFEYGLTLERERQEEEEERRKAAEAAAREAKAAAKSKGKAPHSTNAATPKTPGTPAVTANGKRRGRPSKAEMLARRLEKETQVDENAEVPLPLPPTRTTGPSLSTPKKERLAAAAASAPASELDTDAQDDVEDEGDVDMIDDVEEADAAIFQQLYNEASSAAGGEAENGDSIEDEDDEIPARTTPRSHAATPWKSVDSTPKQSTPRSSLLQVEIRSRNGSAHAPTPKTVPAQKTTLQHYGFTPAVRSSGQWPSSVRGPGLDIDATPTTVPAVPADSAMVDTPTADAKPRRKRKRASSPGEQQQKQDDVEEEEGVAYEVKRLEGMKTEEYEDGTRARFFKVRWKGNWPADQNPTWEPEENISRKMIKDYLRRRARKSAAGSPAGSSSRKKTPTAHRHPPAPPARKYSSVAEAFEGAADELAASVAASSGQASRAGSAAKRDRVRLNGLDEDDEEGADEDLQLVTFGPPDEPDDGGEEQLVVTEQEHQRASPSVSFPMRASFGGAFIQGGGANHYPPYHQHG